MSMENLYTYLRFNQQLSWSQLWCGKESVDEKGPWMCSCPDHPVGFRDSMDPSRYYCMVTLRLELKWAAGLAVSEYLKISSSFLQWAHICCAVPYLRLLSWSSSRLPTNFWPLHRKDSAVALFPYCPSSPTGRRGKCQIGRNWKAMMVKDNKSNSVQQWRKATGQIK